MKKLKKLAAIILAGALSITCFGGCGSSSDAGSTTGKADKSSVDAIKDRGTIKIGVFSDKAPFGYVDSNGENQGFDVYIAKRFAKDLLGDR